MLYIICALKAEAQAFVDRYRLSKTKENSHLKLIVSGVGSLNSFNATKKIVDIMRDDDIIINVGICGGDSRYSIGELIDASRENLICVDTPVSQKGIYELVDMESAGFLKATQGVVERRYVFKVVSDHFEPEIITKERTKLLIFNAIDDINRRIV